MINTKRMKKLASYNYYGVTEAAYQMGKYLYFSVIDHRECDLKLTGIYDVLGVYRVNREYIDQWMEARGIK